MSKEAFIELVWQEYEPKKLVFPVAFQQKFDGVPVRFINENGNITGYTRQHEPITGIKHLLEVAKFLLIKEGASFTGELYIPGMNFKDISGMVSHTKILKPNLNCYVFDFDLTDQPGASWIDRHNVFSMGLGSYLAAGGQAKEDCPVKLVPSVMCETPEKVQSTFDMLTTAYPTVEGAVLHSISKTYQPGKRLALTQKLKETPTIDLLVTGFKEAINKKTGSGNGMVGRIIAQLSRMQPSADGSTKLVTTETGVGPGALKHAEREMLFRQQRQGKFKPRIAEIRYMRDDSYTGLRQGTFVRWRDDKSTGDIRG